MYLRLILRLALQKVWGITIGNTVVQNGLQRHLPDTFLAIFPEGISIAYAVIPQIPTLPQPLKDEARAAFANSLSLLWKIMAGIAGAGLLSSLPMLEVPMHSLTDEDWGAEEKQ